MGQGPLAHLVDALACQPQLTGGRPVEAAQQMEQGRLPAAARSHHGHGLASNHVQVDTVNGADESLSAAVVLAEIPGPHNGLAGLVHRLPFRSVQVPSHASSQRRSAWRRSTIPSSSSQASDRAGSAITARWASRNRRSSSRR
jgi:hypothetical protein